MTELTNRFWPAVKYLLVPYLFLLFLLFYPIPYNITAPGGLIEGEHLVEIEQTTPKQLSGSFSTTYVIYIPKMTFFQFLVSTFSSSVDVNPLTGPNQHYSNAENIQIAYCDKNTSIHAAIIVAYEAAKPLNPNVNFELEERVLVYGKAQDMFNYQQVGLCDDFVQVVTDQGVLTDFSQIGAQTTAGNTYTFTFRNQTGQNYEVEIQKNATTNRFGLTLNRVYFVNEATIFPKSRLVPSLVGGSSGGLLQTLYIYANLLEEDITSGLKIAGTGTIAYDGSVGYIGGIRQKVITAYYANVDVFFVPYLNPNYEYDNYLEAVRVCKELGIEYEEWLIPVSTFQEAVLYLQSRGE